MTIAVWEKPKSQTTKVDFKNPSSQRRYGANGSADKTAIILAVAALAPSVDTTIDMQSGATIPLFLNNVDCDEFASGNWDLVFSYSDTANTVEVSFNFGVETIKRFVSRRDVRSYNALSPAGPTTNTAADDAIAAADVVFAAADGVAGGALAPTAESAAADAVTAANVAFVDATVKTDTLSAATKTTAVVASANAAAAAAYSCGSAVRDAAAAAYAGDCAAAQAAATLAATAAAEVAAASADATLDASDATAEAGFATAAIPAIDVGGVSAAAAAAATASAAAATALADSVSALSADADDAASAAAAAAAAACADTTPGNTVPDFHRMVGWDGAELKGYDIEVGKVEISITKKWARASLAGTYLKTLADYNEQTPVADATFTIVWMGQTLSFARGTFRFRTSTVKSDSGSALEITYNFHYQRNTTSADNFTVGNSAPIIKEGHHGVWIYSQLGNSNGRAIPIPQSVHIFEQYPYLTFGVLNL